MNYWIWYALLDTLKPIQKKKLLDIYNMPEKVFNAKRTELENLKFLKESNIDEIFQKRDINLINKYEKYMNENNIKLINIVDSKYPESLKRIYDPPITLFTKGNIKLLEKVAIAIIGCREASAYGLCMSKKMSYELASKNIVIVSGMAKGIDGMAHIGAIKAKRCYNCGTWVWCGLSLSA